MGQVTPTKIIILHTLWTGDCKRTQIEHVYRVRMWFEKSTLINRPRKISAGDFVPEHFAYSSAARTLTVVSVTTGDVLSHAFYSCGRESKYCPCDEHVPYDVRNTRKLFGECNWSRASTNCVTIHHDNMYNANYLSYAKGGETVANAFSI